MEPVTDPRDEGCLCHGCGRRYKVDIVVADPVWQRIKPPWSLPEAGLLCGRCIANQLEVLGDFKALALVDADEARRLGTDLANYKAMYDESCKHGLVLLDHITALEDYATHWASCPVDDIRDAKHPNCDCGLRDLLAKAVGR